MIRSSRQLTIRAAGGDEDLDFAVFRFTLGIPGFNDDLIPRVVGGLGAVLLLANRIATGASAPAAEARTEALGVLIAAACILTPTVQARLADMQPGRARQSSKPDAKPSFLLADGLTEGIRKELAWASYALLRNTNTTSILILHNGRAIAARGALGSEAGGSLTSIEQAAATALASTQQLRQVAAGDQQWYLPDAASLRQAGINGWSLAPSSAQAALALGLAGGPTAGSGGSSGEQASLLLLFSDQSRGLSQRQRSWAAAVAAKLRGVLS